MKDSYFSRRSLLLIFPLASAVSLAGCASISHSPEIQAPSELSIRTDPPTQVSAEQVTKQSQQFALMALFAKTVYRNDILDEKARTEKACEYLEHPTHRDVLLDMPRDADGGGWSRWTRSGSCFGGDGLYFETYVHRNNKEVIDEAVIAFRGTENTKSQIVSDWGANLSGILPVASNEYSLAKTLIGPIITALENIPSPADSSKHVDIYLTGHSLGGGIAQYIAYSFDSSIKKTFTFDTSPVTHGTHLSDEEQKLDPEIDRIYMDHEFLSFIRNVTTRLTKRRFHRTDYEFYFVDQGAIKSHNMSHLTCQFAARIKDPVEDHHYSVASATATLNNPILCPNDVRALIPKNLLENH